MAGQAQQADPWQPTGQSQQQDSWQRLPKQLDTDPNSPAAQMFQEAAQSLQDQFKPDSVGAPASVPVQSASPEEHAQGAMDLFSDSPESESAQEKPKKRLSDLMPKLGPKP
jgi:hypothetical protein